MEIQSVCTLDQAQSLDRAIREAGLEWPEIEWKHWLYDCAEDGKLILSQSGVDLKEELEVYTPKRIIPAPTGMELAAMIPKGYPMPQIGKNGRWGAKRYNLIRGTFQEALYKYVACLIGHEPDVLKAHWATLK